MPSDSAQVSIREQREAVISSCSKYRYRLSRRWGDAGANVLWIMLNPSTADAEQDDPTIRRCIGFSKALGFSGLYVGNLYAFRATDPSALRGLAPGEARGPDNIAHVLSMADRSERVICAWGAKGGPGLPPWLEPLRKRAPMCLGTTKGGAPRHPLYLPMSAKLEPFS